MDDTLGKRICLLACVSVLCFAWLLPLAPVRKKLGIKETNVLPYVLVMACVLA